MLRLNIGDMCVECTQPTGYGSGKYVNRIPADSTWFAYTTSDETIDVHVDGYMCEECQSLVCDKCGGRTPDYLIHEGCIWCMDCTDAAGIVQDLI